MKRFIDILLVLLGSVVWLPVLLILLVINTVIHGWPPLFTQRRGGYQGKGFNLYKLRSMTYEVDETGNPLPDEARLTRFGRFLRATSLDEIPALFNVLRGDMSLVGPRPFMAEYLPLYSEHQRRRHDVRPGLTGWAQINGRNALSWEEKFDLDVWYVDNRSLWLDMKILLITLVKIITREGINADGEATMPRFRGSDTGNSE